MEAVRFGALPLLPDNLSYPEIIPQKFHGDLLYSSFDDLVVKLGDMLKEYGRFDMAYGVWSMEDLKQRVGGLI